MNWEKNGDDRSPTLLLFLLRGLLFLIAGLLSLERDRGGDCCSTVGGSDVIHDATGSYIHGEKKTAQPHGAIIDCSSSSTRRMRELIPDASASETFGGRGKGVMM